MSVVCKALVLAGGKGARLRPLTYAMAKQLAPVANKPILYYAMESLWEAGIRDFGVIISPETGAAIQEALARWQRHKQQSYPGETPCRITFIPQAEPAGLAHAVAIARPYLGDDAFIMYLGDNLINGDLRGLMDAFEAARDQAASILLTPVENPCAFGVATLDEDGGVRQLIEKPQNPPSNLALVGVYLFRPAIFDAIAKIAPSARGELEITDAIQRLIDDGCGVLSRIHQGWWLDTGKKTTCWPPIAGFWRRCRRTPPRFARPAAIKRRLRRRPHGRAIAFDALSNCRPCGHWRRLRTARRYAGA